MPGKMTTMLNAVGRDLSRLYAGLGLTTDTLWQARLPAGAAIIAANHPATTDPFLMMGLTDEPIYILITDMCFAMPLLGRFLRGAGHIPVVAGDGATALATALELLRSGKKVGIFPEGALSPLGGGACHPHTGTARMAIASGAPVVPVGVALDRARIRYVQARGGGQVETARIYVGGPYALTGGQPLWFGGDLDDRAYVRAAAGQIMAEIMGLAAQSAQRLAGRCAAPLPLPYVWPMDTCPPGLAAARGPVLA